MRTGAIFLTFINDEIADSINVYERCFKAIANFDGGWLRIPVIVCFGGNRNDPGTGIMDPRECAARHVGS